MAGRCLHRLRQVHRRRARRASGCEPADWRADRDRGQQGAAVQRRLRAQERSQGAKRRKAGRLSPASTRAYAPGHRFPTGWRRSSKSVAARSCSGSTPIRPVCGRRRSSPGATAHRRRARRPTKHAHWRPRQSRCTAASRSTPPVRPASPSSRSSRRFERLGAPGWSALEDVCAYASDRGLLVIADGKRGDVPVTAAAYAQALRHLHTAPPSARSRASAPTRSPPTRCSAATRSSRSSTRPSRPAPACSSSSARATPAASTSRTAPLADGRPLYEALARRSPTTPASRRSSSDGLSAVGAVTGATRPDLLERLRELMPRAVFLLPGVGAQGGTVEDLAPAWANHPAGGLVTASRSIVNAYESSGGDPAEAARARRRGATGGGLGARRADCRDGVAFGAEWPARGYDWPTSMGTYARRSPLRFLAPVALVVFGLALLVIVSTSNGGDGNERPTASEQAKERDLGRPSAASAGSAKRRGGQRELPTKHLHREERRHARLDRGEDRHPGREAPGAQPRARPAAARLRSEDQAARVTPARGGSPRRWPRRSPLLLSRGAAAAPRPDAREAADQRRRPPSSSTRRPARRCTRADANRRHAIASTTKLMTALVARERAELDDVFPASDYRPPRSSPRSACARASG